MLTGLSLPSGDVETNACFRGLIASRSVNNVMTEIGPPHALDFTTDSLASLGQCSRHGQRQEYARHLEEAELWIQQVLWQACAKIPKVTDAQTQLTGAS